jgi:hypothetical protein
MNLFKMPTPAFLIHPKITVYRSEIEAGDLGDVGKFYTCEDWHGCYVFTIDDKYIYPPDYASRMIETIEKYGRKAVVSCHGRLIKPNCTSYYMDPAEMFLLGAAVETDTFVHECGTGCMALHTDTVKVPLEIFTHTNITDILVSRWLQKQKIPILIMQHRYGWVRFSPKADHVYSIHNFCNREDSIQTQLVNSFKWKINTCPEAHAIQ